MKPSTARHQFPFPARNDFIRLVVIYLNYRHQPLFAAKSREKTVKTMQQAGGTPQNALPTADQKKVIGQAPEDRPHRPLHYLTDR
jgi:hypothetical protein